MGASFCYVADGPLQGAIIGRQDRGDHGQAFDAAGDGLRDDLSPQSCAESKRVETSLFRPFFKLPLSA
ncbi:hypothetical protein ABID58_005789 [Bradyrhizobium sp. S3.2.6]|uniref:hypothetical protein n=1 Tax=Bradyrhizobium sp. S3.2.6 TaxID=3156428 RepID=UPI00339820EF